MEGAMAEPKKYYRSQNNKIIAGVAGGLAEYFDMDSTLMRAIVAALIVAGVGIIIYLALWIVVPYRPQGVPATQSPTA
jgi:phage shock protein C